MISAVCAFLGVPASLNAECCRLGRIRSNGIVIVGDQVRSTQVDKIVVLVGIPWPPLSNHTDIASRIFESMRCGRSFVSVDTHDIPTTFGGPQSPIQNGLI